MDRDKLAEKAVEFYNRWMQDPENEGCTWGTRWVLADFALEVLAERDAEVDAIKEWNRRDHEARLVEALESTANASRQTLDIIKRERFVFDDLTDRWQKLAFTIYTELTQASTDAKNALAEHRGKQ